VLTRLSSSIKARGAPRTAVVFSSFYFDRDPTLRDSLPHWEELDYVFARDVISSWENPYYAGADNPKAVVLSLSNGRVTKAEELFPWLNQTKSSR
jgi:hypothetical protein